MNFISIIGPHLNRITAYCDIYKTKEAPINMSTVQFTYWHHLCYSLSWIVDGIFFRVGCAWSLVSYKYSWFLWSRFWVLLVYSIFQYKFDQYFTWYILDSHLVFQSTSKVWVYPFKLNFVKFWSFMPKPPQLWSIWPLIILIKELKVGTSWQYLYSLLIFTITKDLPVCNHITKAILQLNVEHIFLLIPLFR